MTNKKYTPKTNEDALNEDYLFALTANDLLIAIIAGKIDPVTAARIELKKRGFNEKGEFVGIFYR